MTKKKIILDPCIPCKMTGAYSKAYCYTTVHGANFGVCYKHTQRILKVGRPVKEETYPLEDKSSLGATGTYGGKKPMNPASYIPNPDVR